ncbi:MAG: AAA family ATPase [Planctomycetota bacterium]
MFIERISVEKFGALEGTEIDRLGPGVQVLYGTNETGKTTLLEFVRAVFFGFEGLFRRGVLDASRPCAGRLLVRMPPEQTLIAIERRHEGPELAGVTNESYADDVVGLGGDAGDLVRIADVDPRHDAAARHRIYLQDLVGDIDETTFTSVMAFGLDELHELRTLEPEGCGRRLYELAAGLDRSTVARVLSHLREAMRRLDASDPAVSPVAALEARRADVLERMAAAGAPAVAAGGLWAELAHLDAEIAAVEPRITAAERGEGVVRGVIALEPLHAEWRRTAERLAALESVPLVHADRDSWRLASRRLRRIERLAAKRKKLRGKLARQLRDVPAESAVWRKRALVAGILEDAPKLERLSAEAARAESHARLAARRFGEQVGLAGLSRVVPIAAALDASGPLTPDVLLPEGFALSFGPLRDRARDCSRAGREVAEARRGLAEARRSLDDTRGSVKGAGSTLAGLSIAQAIEQAAGRVAAIRRRITAGDQLAELDRTIAGLDRAAAESVENQLVPLPWLLALGTLFTLGTGMLLSGLLLPREVTGSMAYALAALGLAGAGIASVTTWSLDKNTTARLDRLRRQLELARKQRDELLAQCGALDADLAGDAATSLDRRLAAAQAELDRLEDLLAREGSMHVLTDRVTLAEQAVARAVEARTAARGRWRKALAQRGLPEDLSPREVRQIAAHRHTLLTLDDDRRRLSEEARHKREELAALGRRIDEVLVECELVPEATPAEHLQLLQDRLDVDRGAIRRRGSLTRRLESARRRHRSAVRQVRVAERAIRELLDRWGVKTAEEFLAKVDRRPEYEETRAAAAAAETAWSNARRRTTEPPEVDRWLAEATVVPLATRLAEAREATHRHRATLSAARERREAVLRRVEAAAHDRTLEALQAELATIEDLLVQQQHRRDLLHRAHVLLEQTRAAVARDHQPPVLREASRWLARLTEGRYPSITTAIDEARLEVHDQEGELWNPERLSRGTREQVFLALRLALIRDLGRHDVSLPVVMDDALVNFDDARARSAARVLVEFITELAADRQMLVLTCHEHVARTFAAAGAHVRSFSDPRPLWHEASRPSPSPTPVPVAAPAPQPLPVVDATPIAPPVVVDAGDLWPAEAFFFGRESTPAAGEPTKRSRRRTR